jgi:ribosomal protein L11 methyltransferase
MASLVMRVELERAVAEAVSDALLEAGAQAVSLEALDCPFTQLSVFFDEASDPARTLERALGQCAAGAARHVSIESLADEDWVRRSQAQFTPVRVGRLWIGASWHEAPPALATIRIDPGLAFGTGSHASTRLVLAFLDHAITGGERVLDYGCGSGILAIAAAKLGAARVDAVDIDPAALEVTRENARTNGVSLDACLPASLAAGNYDVVLANILAQPLVELAAELAQRTTRGGRIALSGVLDRQAGEVLEAYRRDFEMIVGAREEGWALLSGARR